MRKKLEHKFCANKSMTLRTQLLRQLMIDDARGLALSPSRAVPLLRSEGLVTAHYDERCASVDLWYITHERKVNTSCLVLDESSVAREDPLRAIWFRVVFQAFSDMRSGRPCDLHAWRGDRPPAGESCTDEVHLCAESAVRFLSLLGDNACDMIGVSRETIQSMLKEEDRLCLDDPLCS